jgi:hypothetical protein|uniref:Uncharacterized protein n=1 Tax=Picea glauca TaxID=3330 RepID=A0A117NIP5_PICGL|nr:hypothetical protein ABT39_MTgene140 [Picea glauca]KUM50300.1 hypothetical protein ABT39_MTgene143 [Picea glauca]KUM50321.1 hypothetical protein ABT39_MTgene164 [Picea glauca]
MLAPPVGKLLDLLRGLDLDMLLLLVQLDKMELDQEKLVLGQQG